MDEMNIAVVGLGFVGLELAMALVKHFRVIGYDSDSQRISGLISGQDRNLQFKVDEIKKSKLALTSNVDLIKSANVYIITVPTPALFDEYPDLEILKIASQDIGRLLKKNDIVIYESSVYPGTTTQICIPILETYSHLEENKDFFVGYSPERICPSDKSHPIEKISKLIAAKNSYVLQVMQHIYEKVACHIHPVSKIEHAEASKLLENTQRDVNIALMNEFTKIMHAMDLNMHEILEAAETKFNFIPFKPGLVGGHCIAVDPLYMAFQAKQMGVQPELILTARKVNDSMTKFILDELLKLLTLNVKHTASYQIGIFGITYKENIPDIRNSLVFKFIKESKDFPFHFKVHDPYFEGNIHGIPITSFEAIEQLDVAIVFVNHQFYVEQGLKNFIKKCKKPIIIMDIPTTFIGEDELISSIHYWHL